MTIATEQQRDDSLGDLVGQLSEDLRELVSTQLQLARLELSEEVQRAKEASMMFGIAAIAGWLTLVLVSFAAAWGLAEVIPPGWAFLAVGLVWGVTALVAALRGRTAMRKVEMVPMTMRTMKEDAQWARQQVR